MRRIGKTNDVGTARQGRFIVSYYATKQERRLFDQRMDTTSVRACLQEAIVATLSLLSTLRSEEDT